MDHAIFSNLATLVQLHANLADDLAPAGSSPDDTAKGSTIAAAFTALAPFFKMYATYSASYGRVPAALKQVRSEIPAVDAFLHAAYERHGAGGGGVALEAYLFRPVQRMCLYPLLFKQALTARTKVEKWWEAEKGGSAASGKTNQRDQLAALFELVKQTLGSVNEVTRALGLALGLGLALALSLALSLALAPTLHPHPRPRTCARKKRGTTRWPCSPPR